LVHFSESGKHPKEFWRLNACTIEWKEQKKRLLDDPEKFCDKNRYADILAFDYNRVHLQPRPSIASGDPFVNSYINANFVDGPVGPVGNQKLIAC